jgi:hypothetical protein
MAGYYRLKIDQKTEASFKRLKQWCRYNRVPLGRIMNAMIRSAGELPNYGKMDVPRHSIVDIQYPRQIDIDNQLKYKKRKDGQTVRY